MFLKTITGREKNMYVLNRQVFSVVVGGRGQLSSSSKHANEIMMFLSKPSGTATVNCKRVIEGSILSQYTENIMPALVLCV